MGDKKQTGCDWGVHGYQTNGTKRWLVMPGARILPSAGPSVNLVPGIHVFSSFVR
jgi:hypothetical protein